MILIDQLGTSHTFEKIPSRIVSMVPSHTETLSDLGLEDSIIGITKFCVHPRHFKKQKTIVGGTKNANYDKIIKLKPDIIFCNKEENTIEIVQELRKICMVWVTDIVTLDDNKNLINDFGKIFDKQKIAAQFNEKIEAKINAITVNEKSQKKVAYCIWKNPWMVVGGKTYLDTMLQINHLKNVFDGQSRYPETNLDELRALKLDYFLLATEPYPFKEKDVLEIQKLIPNTSCKIVDGEMFSWHGTRLLKASDYFDLLRF